MLQGRPTTNKRLVKLAYHCHRPCSYQPSYDDYHAHCTVVQGGGSRGGDSTDGGAETDSPYVSTTAEDSVHVFTP